jgi:hypothetical protein
MAITKNELKGVIKECLLEILAEGLGSSLNEVASKKKQANVIAERKQQDLRMQERKRSLADSIKFATGGDNVLSQVLAHTAETTFKEQMSNEPRHALMAEGVSPDNFDMGGGDPGLDISNIFGSASKNWAAAAFSSKKKLG